MELKGRFLLIEDDFPTVLVSFVEGLYSSPDNGGAHVGSPPWTISRRKLTVLFEELDVSLDFADVDDFLGNARIVTNNGTKNISISKASSNCNFTVVRTPELA